MRQLPGPGAVIDEDYVIVRELGRGAMGVVFLATQTGLGRDVALKLMSPALDEPEFRVRFEREARMLAKLSSPYVVSVHEFGEHDGWLYLTTPYLPLGDLSARIAKELLEPDEALRLLSQAAAGLAAAHAVGILHRDIKPTNILVAEDPDGLRALLSDFGIARDTSAPSAEVTQGVMGTYAYMPPERFSGNPADPRTDVYAMGCVLWAMLHGSPPFVDPQGQLRLQEVLNSAAPVYAGPAAGAINSILGRCLGKDPAGRFADAGELLAAIEQGRDTPDPFETVRADVRGSSETGPAAMTIPVAHAHVSLPPPAPADRFVASGAPGGPGRPKRGRGLLAAIVTAAVILLLGGVVTTIVLLSRDGDSVTPEGPPEPTDERLAHAPKDDVCRALDPDRLQDLANDSPVVPCSQTHNAFTFEVYATDTPDEEDGSRCIRDAVALLGDKPERYFATALSVAFWMPTPDQAADGASWIRCDLVLSLDGQVRSLPDTEWRNGFLDDEPGDAVSLCTAETGTVVLCSEPHADSVVDVPRISGQPAYPSPEELANLAGESCPAGTPYFHTEQFEWESGYPYLVCFG